MDIGPVVTRASLLEALESLAWRSLIERRSGAYTEQPVVMEYVTHRLIEQISTELIRLQLIHNRIKYLRLDCEQQDRRGYQVLILSCHLYAVLLG
nr:hypothetical protein [Leptolyngbya sp. 7M]